MTSVNVVVSCPEETIEKENVMKYIESIAIKGNNNLIVGYDWCSRKEFNEYINWDDEENIKQSVWFIFYVGQISGILMGLLQCFPTVYLWQIEGGRVCNFEQKYMPEIVNEVVKDLEDKGFNNLSTKVKIKKVSFEDFKKNFQDYLPSPTIPSRPLSATELTDYN